MTRRETAGKIGRLLPFYGLGLLAVTGIKLFYSRAGAGDLDWILAPTCRLAGLLIGTSFQREAGIGWVCHEHRLIVAPACAGLNFLIICLATLYFSFLHRLAGSPARLAWLGASLGLSALLTLGTNALRICAAIRLREMDLYGGMVTPERVHRLEGTVLYCLTLLGAHRQVDRLFERFQASRRGSAPAVLAPLGWYLAVTVGVPLLHRAYLRDAARFLEHSALVAGVCLLLVAALRIREGMLPGARGAKIRGDSGPR